MGLIVFIGWMQPRYSTNTPLLFLCKNKKYFKSFVVIHRISRPNDKEMFKTHQGFRHYNIG
ncbi:hypothetical protein CLV98_11045 [Dyadobacter jejuensis]|uniref:Uncharacterized protein n=1 Tax=Dyadobacter jejuensis TaxID=1082580 RepID=A0A316AIE3_9BACT|nr:hypothetical protein CLV98_11045 [Dyadobacter jejuensis]